MDKETVKGVIEKLKKKDHFSAKEIIKTSVKAKLDSDIEEFKKEEVYKRFDKKEEK